MADRLRIAHIVLQLETGGMERLVTEFARLADRTRFELRFITLGFRGPLASDIESHGWPVLALDTPPGVRPTLVHRLTRLFKSERIDIVHTHNTKPLLYAGPAARWAGVRGVIHTRHGQRRGATPLHNRLFRLASRCTDRMVCVSSDSARLCRHEGIDPDIVRTVASGIDLTRFENRGPAANGPAVFVGRLSPEKDVATLLRAAAVVISQLPSFRLDIAGNGACEAKLQSLAKDLKLNSHVRFLGEVANVPELLRTASMFVLPSLSEGLPVTVLEAMACGLPVVATNVGGTSEAVDTGGTGLLVQPGEAAPLAEAMLNVARNPILARRMGLAGRRRVEGQFDVRTMVARYEAMYSEVANHHARLAA